MRVACISASRIPSDTANSIQVMKVCQAIARIGHDVRLLVPGEESASWASLSGHYGLDPDHPFAIRWIPARARMRRYDFSLAAVRSARAWRADALYAWPLQAALFGLLARFPLALELHGPPEGRIGPTLFRLILALPGRKRLLPITQALVHLLAARYRLPTAPGALVVAPNGVDMARYESLPDPEEARRELGLPDRPTVGYSGHLYPGRGMALMLELARRHPRVQFLWVGGRPADVVRWRDALTEAGVPNVHLAGFVANQMLPRYQAAAEILLMPYETAIAGSGGGDSAAYASPMKMFEYLASGRAILSSDLPVLREVLDEEVAVLCPPEDVSAWSQALGALLDQPRRRVQLGGRAQAVARRYTWRRRAQRCLDRLLPEAAMVSE